MKVRLLTVSQRQPGWVLDGEQDYVRRLPREWAFETVEIKPAHRGKSVGDDRIRATEAEYLFFSRVFGIEPADDLAGALVGARVANASWN